MNRDLDHNRIVIGITIGVRLGSAGMKRSRRGEPFCLGQRPYVAKLFFPIGLRCVDGFPSDQRT
jgi:hypothetical protein